VRGIHQKKDKSMLMQLLKYVLPIALVTSLNCLELHAGEIINEVDDSLSVTDSGLLILELTPEEFRPASLIDLESKTVSFTPASAGYEVETTALQFEENKGSFFDSYGQAAVSLDAFSFPFAGSNWDSIYINHVGTITLREKPTRRWNGLSHLETELSVLSNPIDNQPIIAPLFNHQWNSEVLVSQLSDRVVITWQSHWGSNGFTFSPSIWKEKTTFFRLYSMPMAPLISILRYSNQRLASWESFHIQQKTKTFRTLR
jgi:hypothetical protein